jgi:hypothetical protein
MNKNRVRKENIESATNPEETQNNHLTIPSTTQKYRAPTAALECLRTKSIHKDYETQRRQ